MNRMPVIAIVGRPNVGKSSLLNAIVGKRISIVQDMPGVTRDRVSYEHQIDGRWIELVDTGGYGFIDPDQLTEHIRHQIEIAMTRADLVLFIVDCPAGLTSADQEIAALLRRKGINTVLIANKCDGERFDAVLGDFARVGLGTPVGVSALNGRNVPEVIDAIRSKIDLSKAPTELPQPEMLAAIVGKRNAGKSTLVNAIAKLYEGDPERVIVSEVPGTTRDSIDVRFEKEGKTLIVIDTAGVRKKRQMVTHDIEFYSYHRAQRSIRRADVVMLLIDATEPISEPDRKLAQYIAEEFKPVLLVINKWDLAKDIFRAKKKLGDSEIVDDRELMEKYREYVDEEVPYLDFAPMVFVTAKEGKNVQTAVDQAQHLFNQARHRMTTGRLNHAIREILIEKTPSTPYGRKAKVYFAAQIDVNPPTIVLVVNTPDFFAESYRRFIIRRMRDLLPYAEVPIRLLLNPRGQRTTERSLDEVDNEEELNKERDLPSTKPVVVQIGVPAAPKTKPKAATTPQPRPKPQQNVAHGRAKPRARFKKSGQRRK